MPRTRTFVDTNVLIAAFLDQGPTGDAAEDVLLDPDREFIGSDFLRLELLPKPAFHRQHAALRFYEEFLTKHCQTEIETTPTLVKEAEAEARRYDLSAADALHVATAKHARVDELVTAEKPTKPIFRVQDLKIISIRQTP